MNQRILLATPPFTQLNTPYPATAYLKGFLNSKGATAYQADLGIEVMLELFSKQGLTQLFERLEGFTGEVSENIQRIFHLQEYYLQTIDAVMSFLQHEHDTLAYQICERNFLPEAGRFAQLTDLEWAFGTLGIRYKARHLATLYLEDLADLIKETIDPHFGFSRYAEKLGVAIVSFDGMYEALKSPNSLVFEIQ
ncbi:MAG TPA: radical SAM protein, partial [Saprospiraceae bacterium]|nr:radical SAM protein [Saprospiraceae bacterium]